MCKVASRPVATAGVRTRGTMELGCLCGGTDEGPEEPTPALLRLIEDVADGVWAGRKWLHGIYGGCHGIQLH